MPSTCVVQDNRAARLAALADAAEHKRKNPTPSMSHDGATSGTGARQQSTFVPDEQSEDEPFDREAAGPSCANCIILLCDCHQNLIHIASVVCMHVQHVDVRLFSGRYKVAIATSVMQKLFHS